MTDNEETSRQPSRRTNEDPCDSACWALAFSTFMEKRLRRAPAWLDIAEPARRSPNGRLTQCGRASRRLLRESDMSGAAHAATRSTCLRCGHDRGELIATLKALGLASCKAYQPAGAGPHRWPSPFPRRRMTWPRRSTRPAGKVNRACAACAGFRRRAGPPSCLVQASAVMRTISSHSCGGGIDASSF